MSRLFVTCHYVFDIAPAGPTYCNSGSRAGETQRTQAKHAKQRHNRGKQRRDDVEAHPRNLNTTTLPWCLTSANRRAGLRCQLGSGPAASLERVGEGRTSQPMLRGGCERKGRIQDQPTYVCLERGRCGKRRGRILLRVLPRVGLLLASLFQPFLPPSLDLSSLGAKRPAVSTNRCLAGEWGVTSINCLSLSLPRRRGANPECVFSLGHLIGGHTDQAGNPQSDR
ncbi:unnamed protein product [Protopolystoma xenopodis]|uniref:Uncharacterized protein n=1 Tax=Protopolystoma xenopodis TaxID=117903 RepID=A0A3S5C6K8_9PLAT|nr:unnamed protein product [Protopolystoma xenopodis]